MEITEEQYEALFTAEVPDVKICLHELRIQPVNVEIDGQSHIGYVARMVGHGADGKTMTVDFVATEAVLQETMSRFIEAGMMAAFSGAAQAASEGDTGPLLAILADVIGVDPKEIDSAGHTDHERTGDATDGSRSG